MTFAEWVAWAERAAYGRLGLLPKDFYSLTPMELMKMLEARDEAEEAARWERAYWTANLMSIHTKRPVRPDRLMRPFRKPKSKAQIAAERDRFFAEFAAKRKEEEAHGDDS